MDNVHGVLDEIWKQILGARFVVADLTGRNANVAYEVGLAHALGKPIVLLTQDENDIPFDLRTRRVLFYEWHAEGMGKLSDRLHRVFGEILTEYADPSSLE